MVCSRSSAELAAKPVERSHLNSGPAIHLEVGCGGLKMQPRMLEIFGLDSLLACRNMGKTELVLAVRCQKRNNPQE